MAGKSRRGGRRSGGSPQKPERPRWRRVLVRTAAWSAVAVVLGVIALAVAVFMTARELPGFGTLKSSQHGQMIIVRAVDGTEIVSLGPSYGDWLTFDEIPQVMKDAMVAVEDRRYYSHIGVDPVGVVRSLWVRFQTGQWRQGGSTITQQLARNIFLNNNRTFGRKIREGILALALEAKFSKQQILELYLNKVYFGGGAYGIDPASRKFFGHPANELSLGEAAIIAGLVKAPSRYAPTANVDAAVSRAKTVLLTMQANGSISSAEAASVDPSTIKLTKERGQNSARYFTDWALPQLDFLLPDSTEPIEVWTTLDLEMQEAATAAIKNNVPAGAQGALVSLDRDGAVRAMVGGTDYVTSNYNRAVNSVRQPGSAWKLFVYLAALEAGYKPDDLVHDEPVTIQGWSPRNSGGSYAGEIDVRTAFAYSKNTVAAQLGNEVGFGTVAAMARRFGITTPITTVPSMVLGTSEVRVIDMARAFAGVSAKGRSVEPYGILKVRTTSGNTLYEHKSRSGNLLVPQYVAAGITDLLQSAVVTGTGRAAAIGRPVAGKTGTTSSNKDGWFIGFSSGLTTAVWMGRDDAKAVGGLSGGRAPAAAFASFMRRAVAKRPVEQFDTELKLPEWQLEPDDEYNFGDPDDYYFVDEDGNLIEPGGVQSQPDNRIEDPNVVVRRGSDREPQRDPSQAASDDFLERAIRGPQQPQSDPGLRQAPRRGDPQAPAGTGQGSAPRRADPPPPADLRQPLGTP